MLWLLHYIVNQALPVAATVPAVSMTGTGGTDVEGPTSSWAPDKLCEVVRGVVGRCRGISSRTVDMMVSSSII